MLIKLCAIAICVSFTFNTFGSDPKNDYVIVEDPTALIVKIPAKQRPFARQGIAGIGKKNKQQNLYLQLNQQVKR